MAELTGKQALFVKHYCVCLNATRAAELAGYKGNRHTLSTVGYENLRKPEIKAAISAHMREHTMLQDEVLERLDAHARADMGDFIDVNTMTVNLKAARDNGISHLIKKMKQTIIMNDKTETQTEIFEFELVDSQAALVHIGRAYGMFKDSLNLKADEPLPIAIVGMDVSKV